MTVAEELGKNNTDEQFVKFIDNNAIQHVNSTEIISGGKLYDVARVTREKGATVLYCYHDSTEESMDAQLVCGIQQNTNNPASQHSPASSSLVKQTVTDYLPEKKMEMNILVLSSSQLHQYTFSFVPEYNRSIQAPPPKG